MTPQHHGRVSARFLPEVLKCCGVVPEAARDGRRHDRGRFHIGKKFQTVQNALGEVLEASLERAKWKLWHGKAEEALAKLAILRNNITDEAQKSKMTGLYNSLIGKPLV